jgi:hypothetical protein
MSVLRASWTCPRVLENTKGGPLSFKSLHQNVETSQASAHKTVANPESVKKFHFGQPRNKRADILNRIGIPSRLTEKIKGAYGDVSEKLSKTPHIVKDYIQAAPTLSIKVPFSRKKTPTPTSAGSGSVKEDASSSGVSKDFSAQVDEISVLSFYDPTAETDSKYKPIQLTEKELEQTLRENAPAEKSQAEDRGLRHLLDRFWATNVKDSTAPVEVKKKMIVRKDYVSRSTISKKTLEHVKLISRAESSVSKLKRLEDFCHHLTLYPDERQTAMKVTTKLLSKNIKCYLSGCKFCMYENQITSEQKKNE